MLFPVFKQRPAFFTLLFSFITIFLIPVVFSIINYFKVEDSLKDNVYNYNAALVEQTRSTIDDYLKSIDLICYQISQDAKLKEMITAEGISEQNNSPDFVNVSSNLRQYKLMNSFIYDMFIVLSKQEKVITSNKKKGLRAFFENDCKYIDMPYKLWQDTVLEIYNYQRYMKTMYISNVPYPQGVITYVQSLPIKETKNIDSQIVILLNSDKIMDVLKKAGRGAGNALIVNKAGQSILSTDNGSINVEDLLHNITTDSNMFEYTIAKEKNVVFYTKSKQNDWTYIIMIPQNTYMEKINKSKWLTLLFYLVCILLGSLIIYFGIKRNYKPLRLIINHIQQIGEKQYNNDTNEFEFIKQQIISSGQNESKLKTILKKQSCILNDQNLIKILKGQINGDDQIINILKTLNLNLESNFFTIIIINLEDYKKFNENDSEREWSLVRFATANILHELSNEKNSGYVVELDKRKIALLMCMDISMVDRYSEEVNYITNKLYTVLKEEFDIDIPIGVSTLQKGISSITNCYNEALTSLDYKFIDGSKHIMLFGELDDIYKSRSDKCYYYPTKIENQIINLVNNGDYDNLCLLLDNVFETNLKSFNMTLDLKQCLFYEILGTFMKTLNNIDADNDIYLDRTESQLNFQEFNTLGSLFSAIKEQYKSLCDYVNSNKRNYSGQMMESIKQYIHENYMDPEISLNSIAGIFEITPQYLSSYFSKNQKEKIVDYIANVRLSKAKELLRDTSLTIVQISNAVGYVNYITFTRFFKKNEGIPPGTYRLNQQQDGKN